MLVHPTVERLRALGLTAMADAFVELQNAPDAGELSREDWLGLLVDREATSRENKRLARRLREADCASLRLSRTLTAAPTAASTVASCSSWRPASGSVSIIIWRWSAQPALASRGWLARSATRPAARGSRCSTNALHVCSSISPRRAAKADCRG